MYDVLRAEPSPPTVVIEPLPAAVPSFVDFYARQRDGIARALSLTLGDADLAAEATDEAMARAYQRWASVSAMESPGGWVYRVGLNWSRSWIRRRHRQPPPLFEPHPGPADMAEPDILVALAELPIDQRAVVVLRLYLGLAEAETAAALRIPVGTAKSRLHRAKQTLEARLDHLRPENIDRENDR